MNKKELMKELNGLLDRHNIQCKKDAKELYRVTNGRIDMLSNNPEEYIDEECAIADANYTGGLRDATEFFIKLLTTE